MADRNIHSFNYYYIHYWQARRCCPNRDATPCKKGRRRKELDQIKKYRILETIGLKEDRKRKVMKEVQRLKPMKRRKINREGIIYERKNLASMAIYTGPIAVQKVV